MNRYAYNMYIGIIAIEQVQKRMALKGGEKTTYDAILMVNVSNHTYILIKYKYTYIYVYIIQIYIYICIYTYTYISMYI
jgi:hypothetical protein